jgi:hypothetical protein
MRNGLPDHDVAKPAVTTQGWRKDEAAMLGNAEKQVNAKEHYPRVDPYCDTYSAVPQKYPIYLMAR